jgi:peptidoglycan/LPS O-acetylase OafA/YrhL
VASVSAGSVGSAVATGAERDPRENRGKAAGFVVGFDGLRAIAALLVVVVHVGAASGFTFRSSLGQYTSRGEIGVSVFFLISGFLLYRPFAAAALAGRPGPNVRSYLVRRALRIVPLYWVALIVTYLFTGWASVHGVSGFLENALFLQVYSRQWVFHGITQAWSLCIEVTFYLALPLWAAWMRRMDRRGGRPHDPAAVLRRELAALAVLYVASILFRLWVVAAPTGPTETARSWLPSWSDHFALGMALAVTGAYVAETGALPKVLRWLTKPGADLFSWVVAAFMFWLVATKVGLDTNPLAVGGAGTDVAREILYGLFGLFLLLPAVFGRPRTGAVRRLLASHVLSLIGLVSYGIYLWHQLVVRELQAHTSWKVLDAPFLPLLATAVVVVIAVSTVSYIFVERPGIAVGHRWLLRQREQAAVHLEHHRS